MKNKIDQKNFHVIMVDVVSLESKLCGNRYLNVKRELSESKSIAISFRSFQLISSTQEEMFLPFFVV